MTLEWQVSSPPPIFNFDEIPASRRRPVRVRRPRRPPRDPHPHPRTGTSREFTLTPTDLVPTPTPTDIVGFALMTVPEPSDDTFVAHVRNELAQANHRCSEILSDPPAPASPN